MLYQAYETRRALLSPMYGLASLSSRALGQLPAPLAGTPSVRAARAVTDTLGALQLTHRRPRFGVETVVVDGEEVAVREDPIASTPFGSVVRFTKETAVEQPRVLIVAALAGHYATILRGTVRTLLPDHDVFITDWHNARDVPKSAGRFGLDEYVEHIMQFLEAIGPGTHVVSVCQPCVATVAAASIMAEDDHPAQPQSLTLIAGPLDARVNPGPVNEFAETHSLDWLEKRAVMTVPRPHRGAGRRVYPGFLQIAGFMSMEPRRHVAAFGRLAADIARGNDTAAKSTMAFYDEYFAILDMPAEFYLDTARVVFKEHDLARGVLQWRGRTVDPAAVSSALLTVEGANDAMCCPGQTEAAHGLLTGIPKTRRRHLLQPGVGHYGVFAGSKFERQIYPEIRKFIATAERRRAPKLRAVA